MTYPAQPLMIRLASKRAAVLRTFAVIGICAAAQAQSANVPASSRPIVSYSAGQLSVSASNSSLNQILREISRQTGLKITGGVADERVFGIYGPAAPPKVLTMLLDGTGSNMLLVQPTTTAPMELVLTPRQGGATPPNPTAPGFNDSSDPNDANPGVSPLRVPPQQNVPPPPTDQRVNHTAAPGSTVATPPADPAPGGVKTPQQIYEQLLRLRQQPQTPQK